MFRRASIYRWVAIALSVLFLTWLLHTGFALWTARSRPVDAFLVLGGSIRREIYAAELAKDYPNTQFLISQGSEDPCIRIIFERINAPLHRVWLEKCADSTFGNFVYSLPILKQWSAHHVRIITSQTHLPRAGWLAQLMLGSHGIWIDLELAAEEGVPANTESWLKTSLDLLRAVAWSGISQVYQPNCTQVFALEMVDLGVWRQKGFKCEHQAGIDEEATDSTFEAPTQDGGSGH